MTDPTLPPRGPQSPSGPTGSPPQQTDAEGLPPRPLTEPAGFGRQPAAPAEDGTGRRPGVRAVQRTARNAMLAGVSLIWLVPIIALIAILGLAWNSWSQRGDLIQVSFNDATGITPGETVLKFREVTVGKVEGVRFSGDLSEVILDIRVDKDVERFIDADSQFWIVRPQVSASGISRLDTVLTGVFIEGYWDSQIGPPQQGPHRGLERAPLTRANQPGRWVVLAADTAKGLSEGAPVLYRGLPVGRMENIRLSDRDEGVLADVFIEAPHDKRLTTATVFWDTAGLSLSLGAQGLALNVGSLSSLLQGGVQFETMTSGGTPVPPGHVFRLNPNEDAARNSLFSGDAAGEVRLTVLVDNAVRGLAKGADVQFQGLAVGRVTDLGLRVADTPPDQPRQVQQEVTIALSPERMGLPPGSTSDQTLAFIADRVREGLRARVASAGFLGTALMIEMIQIPNAAPATLDLAAKPYPLIPSAPGDISDFTATAQGFISKVGQLPLQETLRSAQDMMNSVTALASSEETRNVPRDARATLDEAQKTLAEIRKIAEDLRKSGAMDQAGEAVAATQRAATAVADAVEGVPKVVERLGVVADNAATVDLKKLGDAATEAATALRDVVASDAARELPKRLGTALESFDKAANELRAVTTQLKDSRAVEKLGLMVDEATAAAEAVKVAAAEVPDMVTKIEDTATAVEAFDFAGISAEAKGIVQQLRAMLGTEDAAQLPRNLSDTLKAASGLLNDLRDGNAVGSLNALLASARTATDNIAASVQRLPQLAQRYEQLAARAEAVIATYGNRSAFNVELLGALRELRRATAAFGSLASTIERNPRAFILGR
ncbi:MCE family protein [Paracoccus suum]|uniref:MCE family protein n=1 Tax=Paracoccus suum TaxID=2259340 RepID=A0A344PHN3_9RHOB|nr:MlaD family protein [Paracoccus suum]AXC48888.1 MCE family protein [Paracoccus suum]